MSLINDMLKDLDARRPRANGAADIALQGAGLAVAPVPTEFPYNKLIFGLGIATLAVVTIFGWQNLSRDPAQTGELTHPQVQTTVQRPSQEAVISVTNAAPVHSAFKSRHTAPADSVVTPASETAPAIPIEDPQMQKTMRALTPGEQAELFYQQATTAVQQGRVAEAQSLLREALEQTPNHLQARLTLAGLWIREQRLEQAADLLAEGFALQPQSVDQAQLYGRLLMQIGRDHDALGVLESAVPSAAQNADYQALLGTLYQRLDMSAQAAEQYRRAVGLKPDQAVWWMGLGIALERTRHQDEARSAYRGALQYPMSAAVKRYVEDRLVVLDR